MKYLPSRGMALVIPEKRDSTFDLGGIQLELHGSASIARAPIKGEVVAIGDYKPGDRIEGDFVNFRCPYKIGDIVALDPTWTRATFREGGEQDSGYLVLSDLYELPVQSILGKWDNDKFKIAPHLVLTRPTSSWRTDSGIYTSSTAKKSVTTGTVVDFGDPVQVLGKESGWGEVGRGDRILFHDQAAYAWDHEGERLYLHEAMDVVAVDQNGWSALADWILGEDETNLDKFEVEGKIIQGKMVGGLLIPTEHKKQSAQFMTVVSSSGGVDLDKNMGVEIQTGFEAGDRIIYEPSEPILDYEGFTAIRGQYVMAQV